MEAAKISLWAKIVRLWPILIAGCILLLTVIFQYQKILALNHGTFTYALDDAYIHMSIAKNLALHGVWGVTQYEFSSSASSILWPLLIAGIYKLAGVNTITPLILNLFSALALLGYAFFLLRKMGAKAWVSLLVLIGIIFITPLPTLIFTGMEHTLHALCTVILVFISIQFLANPLAVRSRWLLPLLAFLAVSVRYESIFIIVALAIPFAMKRKFFDYGLMALGGFLPILLYGIYSLSRGWHFLPNSLLLKSGMQDSAFFGEKLLITLKFLADTETQTIWPVIGLYLISAGIYLYLKKKKQADLFFLESIIAVFTLVLGAQILFARFGAFYRYEAYLVAWGILVCCYAIMELHRGHVFQTRKRLFLWTAAAILLIIAFSFNRAAGAYKKTSIAANNIFEQQYQIARFFQKYYNNSSIALNDIGLVSFMTNARVLDVWGLGSGDVANLKMKNQFHDKELSWLINRHDVKAMALYESWLTQRINGFYDRIGKPKEWVKAGEWQVYNDVVLGSSAVSFFSPSQAGLAELSHNLAEFSTLLPKSVM